MQLDSAYLSSPDPYHTPLSAVLEQIFEDLNSYSETSIPLDGFNSLELKLFPFFRELGGKRKTLPDAFDADTLQPTHLSAAIGKFPSRSST